jgi:hypothetical protein
MSTPEDLLSSVDILEPVSHRATTDKDYDKLVRYKNVTSYSQRQLLHACPRKYQLSMYRANNRAEADLRAVNLDFCFGHSVGAGVQNFLQTKDLNKAILAASLSWAAGLDDRKDRAKKSLWEAIIAVEKFTHWDALEDWELLILPNGKPAVELSFSLHARDGFKDYGHIDIVLKNRYTGRLAVLELKTTEREPEEAMYANSSQATGYSIMLGAIYADLTEYTVLYAVYSSALREWNLLPFDKTTRAKAEWIKDLLLDHSAITTYEEIKFYPKRGESCYDYRRRCEFFGECNLVPEEELPVLPEEEEAEEVDWVISIDDVIHQIRAAAGENK